MSKLHRFKTFNESHNSDHVNTELKITTETIEKFQELKNSSYDVYIKNDNFNQGIVNFGTLGHFEYSKDDHSNFYYIAYHNSAFIETDKYEAVDNDSEILDQISKAIQDAKILEKNTYYTDSKIRSMMKQAIVECFKKMKATVKAATDEDQIKRVMVKIPSEIDNLKQFLTGNIMLAINENSLNEANIFTSLLSKLKKTLSPNKNINNFDIYKKNVLNQLEEAEKTLLAELRDLDIDMEKTNARMAKYAGTAYKVKFL